MADIIHRIGIKADISQVYDAIATIERLSGWWTEDTKGLSAVGQKIEFRFHRDDGQLIGGMDMEVEVLESPKRVGWRCKDGPADWVGTTLSFHLSEAEGQTIVLFGHRGWKEATDSMAHCSMKWATFLLSLKALVETGTGRPAPRDLKIDNWN